MLSLLPIHVNQWQFKRHRPATFLRCLQVDGADTQKRESGAANICSIPRPKLIKNTISPTCKKCKSRNPGSNTTSTKVLGLSVSKLNQLNQVNFPARNWEKVNHMLMSLRGLRVHLTYPSSKRVILLQKTAHKGRLQ
jgi:hypothetical protein